MKEGGEEIKEKISIPIPKDGEVYEFGYLIGVILDYYESSKGKLDDGEEWKRGTEHEKKVVPEKLDKMIQTAFEKQLSKFSK